MFGKVKDYFQPPFLEIDEKVQSWLVTNMLNRAHFPRGLTSRAFIWEEIQNRLIRDVFYYKPFGYHYFVFCSVSGLRRIKMWKI